MNSRFPSCPSLRFPVQYAAGPVTHTENERGALTVSSPLQTLSPLSASSFYSLTLTRSGEIFIYLFLTGSLSCMRACVRVCVWMLSLLSLRQEHLSYIMSVLLPTHSPIAEIWCPESVMSRVAFIQLSSCCVCAYAFYRQHLECLMCVSVFPSCCASRVKSHEHQYMHLLQLCHTDWGSHGNGEDDVINKECWGLLIKNNGSVSGHSGYGIISWSVPCKRR